jgi:hypothetical protein
VAFQAAKSPSPAGKMTVAGDCNLP